MTDASLEVRWLVERLGSSEVLFRGQGQHGITIYYSLPVGGGAYYGAGGGRFEKGSWRKL